MAVQDLARIEEKIDRAAAGATEISMKLGGVQFATMVEVMEFSKLMAVSGSAVPPHLRGNPGGCLAICTKALRFGFDPFALAEHSFAMRKPMDVTVVNEGGGRVTKKEDVETIAYDSYVIRAVIEAHAPIKGRLKYDYQGEGDQRRCAVSAVLRDGGAVVTHVSPTLAERLKAIGKNERGFIKGSPLWETKPDQQLAYDTARDFCRRYFPEILMGWYDKDEFEEHVRAETAQDITPKPDIARRLKGKKQDTGFQPAQIEQQISEAKGGEADTSGRHVDRTGADDTKTPQAEQSATPAASSEPAAELAPGDFAALLFEAELAAKGGLREYENFFRKCNAAERRALQKDHERLKEVARKSDEAVGA